MSFLLFSFKFAQLIIRYRKPSENATKIWVLSNDSFRLANNNSQVPPKIMRHLLAVMQASLEEYEELWLQYQKNIKYIDG